MNDTTDFDVAIVGGGLVGISLACALGQLNPAPRVALIEAHDYSTLPPPGFDSRTVALSFSSRQIFAALDLWSSLIDRVTPINTIHISDRGHPGITRLKAQEQAVESLGYVVESRVLGEVLFKAMHQAEHISLFAPARVTDLTIEETAASLELEIDYGDIDIVDNAQTISAKLIVAADGTDSFVRKQLAIAQRSWDYKQSAVIANVATSKPHNNIAYERFTDSGPMALLPLAAYENDAHRYGLVWTVPQNNVERIMAMSDAEFSKALADRFGRRVGDFVRVGKRTAYPLGLSQVAEHVRQRLAFIGNAAHTLHPVAGQGFNLGLRDVAALVEVIKQASAEHKDIGSLAVLGEYAQWRSKDHTTTMLFTDALVRVFSNNFTPLVVARNAGLMAMEMFAPLRKRLTRHAMGYIGKASMLARGLGL
ncbi:MAG: 2-octaprenyl-6-methoxyphenyl hydroxylase [Thioalkalispiraceae bacterium]|jgi:2-octaprenyl-6-methoxyphenol hydroxylase